MGPTQVNHKRSWLTKQLGQMLMRSATSWDMRHVKAVHSCQYSYMRKLTENSMAFETDFAMFVIGFRPGEWRRDGTAMGSNFN